jgi:hypothetical protein
MKKPRVPVFVNGVFYPGLFHAWSAFGYIVGEHKAKGMQFRKGTNVTEFKKLRARIKKHGAYVFRGDVYFYHPTTQKELK